MLDINLLPPEYGPKKLISPGNLVVIGIFSLIALSMIFSSLRLLITIQDYSDKVQYYEEQIKNYQHQVEDIRELGTKVKLLRTRLNMVQGLLEEKSNWSDKLIDLYKCLPENGVWIDQINMEQQKAEVAAQPIEKGSEQDSGKKSEKQPNNAAVQQATARSQKSPIFLKVMGTAVSINKISEFISNIENTSIFENVVFGSTIKGMESKINNETLMSFNFTVQIIEPPEAKS